MHFKSWMGWDHPQGSIEFPGSAPQGTLELRGPTENILGVTLWVKEYDTWQTAFQKTLVSSQNPSCFSYSNAALWVGLYTQMGRDTGGRHPWLLLRGSRGASSHTRGLGCLKEASRGHSSSRDSQPQNCPASLLQMQIFNKSFWFTVWSEVCVKQTPSHTNESLWNLWLKDRLGGGCVLVTSLHLQRLGWGSGVFRNLRWGWLGKFQDDGIAGHWEARG